MGKVYLNADNKLVVETDNAKIEGNETTTVLKSDETFDIDVTTVSKLLALFNDVTLCDKEMYRSGYYFTIISKEELAECVESEKKRADKKAECVESEKKRADKKDEEYREIEGRFINLVDRVREFNSDKKVFWRPINIDDICVN